MKNAAISIGIIFGLMFVSFIIHEFAHFLTAKILGYEVIMTINHVRPVSGQVYMPQHAFLITAAGPLVTLLLGVLGYFLAIKKASLIGLYLLLVSCVHRVIATLVSLNSPNDEMRLSIFLGIGRWTIPALMVLVLVVLSVTAFRKLNPSKWVLVWLWLGSSIALTLVVFGEASFPSIQM